MQDIKSDILAENAKKASQLTLTRNVTFGHQRNWLDPRSIQVASFGNPRAFVYRSFLSPVECDFLIEYAKPSMHKSGVVDADSGSSTFSEIRTSTGSFIPSGMNQMVKQLESRIATWSQVPSSNGEPIQVLRYEAGQEYQAHYDYFFHESGRANNRVATVLMYLSDVQEGGETVFPISSSPKIRDKDLFSQCGNKGLSVKPAKGDAILFWSMKIGGDLDAGSSHAGCPVFQGEKWTATKWLHVSPVSAPEAQQSVFQEGREVNWADCKDSNDACLAWSQQNECSKNPLFMLKECPLSCRKCTGIWREGQYT